MWRGVRRGGGLALRSARSPPASDPRRLGEGPMLMGVFSVCAARCCGPRLPWAAELLKCG